VNEFISMQYAAYFLKNNIPPCGKKKYFVSVETLPEGSPQNFNPEPKTLSWTGVSIMNAKCYETGQLPENRFF